MNPDAAWSSRLPSGLGRSLKDVIEQFMIYKWFEDIEDWQICDDMCDDMVVSKNMATPSYHLFVDGFSLINHPAIGVPPWLWNPPWKGSWDCLKPPDLRCPKLSGFPVPIGLLFLERYPYRCGSHERADVEMSVAVARVSVTWVTWVTCDFSSGIRRKRPNQM